MIPLVFDPARHDQYMSIFSHLPHIAACALSLLGGKVPEDLNFIKQLSGKGFLDATRIAGGDPGLWSDILTDNAGNLVPAIDRLIEELEKIRKALEKEDAEELAKILQTAQTFRSGLNPSKEIK